MHILIAIISFILCVLAVFFAIGVVYHLARFAIFLAKIILEIVIQVFGCGSTKEYLTTTATMFFIMAALIAIGTCA